MCIRRDKFRRLADSVCTKRFGEDRLSQHLSDSIIGAERFHGRVRDGFVCVTLAIPTKSHRTEFMLLFLISLFREITTSHTIRFELYRVFIVS